MPSRMRFRKLQFARGLMQGPAEFSGRGNWAKSAASGMRSVVWFHAWAVPQIGLRHCRRRVGQRTEAPCSGQWISPPAKSLHSNTLNVGGRVEARPFRILSVKECHCLMFLDLTPSRHCRQTPRVRRLEVSVSQTGSDAQLYLQFIHSVIRDGQ